MVKGSSHKVKRNETQRSEMEEEDEYDVDYDNLVVSDIMGISGMQP